MGRRPVNCLNLCPEAYELLSSPTAVYDALGYDEETFFDCFEMDAAAIAAFKAKFKYWPDVVPPEWGTDDSYIIPADLMDWNEDGLLLDLNDMVCDGETGGYYVFLLSTEGWGMM